MAPADATVRVDLLSSSDEEIRQACEGVDAIVSAAGQSTQMLGKGDTRGFAAVDTVANRRLIAAACDVGVKRFAYVAVHPGAQLRTPYVDAHEAVVDSLVSASIEHRIVRPTGFFSGYLELLELARRGRVLLFDDGSHRSNPIDERDLAVAVLDALAGDDVEVSVGGPEILTRRREAELAFEALGKSARVGRVPPAMANMRAALLKPFDQRRSEMLRFLIDVQLRDSVAPCAGHRSLSDFFRDHAPVHAPLSPLGDERRLQRST
jgi:uncharacterized protein YbjT (DUF2867 family)